MKTDPDSWALAPGEHLHRPCQPRVMQTVHLRVCSGFQGADYACHVLHCCWSLVHQTEVPPSSRTEAMSAGAKRQRTARVGDAGREASQGHADPQPARLHSEPSLPGAQPAMLWAVTRPASTCMKRACCGSCLCAISCVLACCMAWSAHGTSCILRLRGGRVLTGWLRWAGSAQKLPRGAAKVMKAHGVFQKLLAGAGSWEAARVIPLTCHAPVRAISACMERMAEYMAHLRRRKPEFPKHLGCCKM